MDLAYATLMEKCPDGTYLYTPPNSKVFHPGSCGYFDDDGLWRLITDLADIKDPDYQPPSKPLVLADPTTCTWKKQLSENHEGRGFGGKAEVSGIAAQAPVDVGANFEIGSTANLRAGVAVSPHVIHHYFNTKALGIIMKWIEDNMTAMIGNHPQQIKDYGVWVVMDTWVTEECDIAMWNKTGSTTDLGAELGATNIGKLGLTTSRDSQSDMNQHRIYNEPGGHAVSFKGVHFKQSSRFWREKKLKQRKPTDGYLRTMPAALETAPYRDEDGNLRKGGKLVNEKGQFIDEDGHVVDKNGRLINEERELIDKDGNLVDEDGRLINKEGDLIDKDGNLVDEDGNILDKEGYPLDKDGNRLPDGMVWDFDLVGFGKEDTTAAQ